MINCKIIKNALLMSAYDIQKQWSA